MAQQFSEKQYGLFSRTLRQGVALGLCSTLLPFTQLQLLAQNAPPPQQSQYPQESQYPYQDPAESAPQQPYGQQQAPPPDYGQQAPPPQYGEQGAPEGGYAGATAYTPQGPQQLEQLVAPIALYPDSLVAQVLAASTYPQQVQEADSWMQQYGNQPPEQLAQAVNQQPWDPSVKALTQFPSVLQQLARSNQWTIALGNAYYNQPADVMAAVQSMRYRAREAGQLRDTPQQVVVEQGPEIIIQPANPEVVYVPYYNPWVCYGEPIPAFVGFYRPPPPPGLILGVGIGIGFGIGIGIAAFGHFGWGYHAWAPNWHSNTIIVNHNTYISRSTTVINHGGFGAYNQGFGRGGPQAFHQASFNPRAPLYNGRPISANNRPPMGGGNFSRPGAPGAGGFNRPAPNGGTNGFNRPGAPGAGNFNRPAAAPNGYNRPAQGAPAYNRPAAPNGGYGRPTTTAQPYNRPATPGYGTARPQMQSAPRPQMQQSPRPQAARPQPAPRPQAAPRPSGGGGHPAAPQHSGGGGGEHHGGGGEHRR